MEKQIKYYKLLLNDMRSDKIEKTKIAAISEDRDKLISWHNDQLDESEWLDGKWRKSFKKGSPLEWFNPTKSFDKISPFNDGIGEEIVNEKFIKDNHFAMSFTIID